MGEAGPEGDLPAAQDAPAGRTEEGEYAKHPRTPAAPGVHALGFEALKRQLKGRGGKSGEGERSYVLLDGRVCDVESIEAGAGENGVDNERHEAKRADGIEQDVGFLLIVGSVRRAASLGYVR
jgi:hypothetical protein